MSGLISEMRIAGETVGSGNIEGFTSSESLTK
jgi:hypothetical protein